MILFVDFLPFRSEQVTLTTVMFLHRYHPRPLSWEKASFPLTVLAFLPYDIHKHWDLVLSLQNSSKSSTWIVLSLKEQPYRLPLVPVLGPENTSWPLSGSTIFDTIQCRILIIFTCSTLHQAALGKKKRGRTCGLSTRNYFPYKNSCLFLPYPRLLLRAGLAGDRMPG